MKKVLSVAMVALFVAGSSAFAGECSKKKECSKDKTECSKDKKECAKEQTACNKSKCTKDKESDAA